MRRCRPEDVRWRHEQVFSPEGEDGSDEFPRLRNLSSAFLFNAIVRSGVGTALIARAAQGILEHATKPAAYLRVLKQNTTAQRFYRARGGAYTEEAPVPPRGGVSSRLNGAPAMLRIVWPDASVLARQR